MRIGWTAVWSALGGHGWRARSSFLLVAVTLVGLLAPAGLLAESPALKRRAHLPFVIKVQSSAYYDGGFGYGLHTVYANDGRTASEIGFGYIKFLLQWTNYEPRRGEYDWTSSGASSIRLMAEAAVARGVRVVIRVDTPPPWAAPGSGNRPPSNPADYGAFLGALAEYMRGRVAAYEIWNEPNLSWEWGNAAPNPEQYTDLLKAAYPRIKAADPSVVVITAGLASTGGDGGVTALNDVEFIERMYGAGAQGYFDALGSHPYGFANSPETRNVNNVTDFQRAADQHRMMEAHADGAKKVWATEFGWIIDPGYYGHPEYIDDPRWSGRQWQRVSPQTQADYLVRAYQYAYANWPWMGVMILFNLDFSTVSYYTPAEPMRWYSILNPDFSLRPAYQALAAMPKPTRR